MLSSRAVKREQRERSPRDAEGIFRALAEMRAYTKADADVRNEGEGGELCALLITIIAVVMRVNSRDTRLMVER